MSKVVNNYKISNFIFLALVITVISLTGLSCSKNSGTPNTTSTTTNTTTTAATDLTNVAPTTVDAAFAANYASSREKAGLWKGDAKLVLISVKLPRNMELNSATESFTYGSDSDKDYWWNMSIAEKTSKYVRAIIPKTDYLGNTVTAIATQYWKINYLEAFQIAETNGGKAFRDKNADTDVTLSLSHSAPKGWLWWVAEYKAASGTTTKVRINPSDKTVVDDLGNIVSAATTSTTTTTTPSTTGTSTTAGTSSSTTGTSTTGTSTTSSQ